MAVCKWCDKKGWFLSVNNDGLCEACQQTVMPNIIRDCQIVVESGKLAKNSKNIGTQLSRIRTAIHSLERLVPYDKRGIPTLTDRPGALIGEFNKFRQDILSDYIQEQLYMARRKAEDAPGAAGKLAGYAKAVEQLDKITGELDDVTMIEGAILALRAERDIVRFQGLQQKAESALLKGNKKAALGAYIDAYLSLSNSSATGDMQADRIKIVKEKIEELGGTIPA